MAEIFNGGVITVEHIIMVVFAAVVGLVLSSRIDRVTAALERIERLLQKMNGQD